MRTPITTTALQLHLCAAIESTAFERQGFVTDRFLSLVADDVALDVAELCITGMWVRRPGGYQVRPFAFRVALDALRELQAATE